MSGERIPQYFRASRGDMDGETGSMTRSSAPYHETTILRGRSRTKLQEVGGPWPPPVFSPSKLGWNRANSYSHLHGAQS
ncbi:hypothetical protein TNCV_1296701 [Trichonephila clavipes]|uniref:Uncharacterized protein n=1 Tax=Trichonephila clavipes TaxID=2585209 RepID=A0A8X6SHW3_TRICX|nr:hypothetical protein TNCV_1296701 [Trichonephila clavipes]